MIKDTPRLSQRGRQIIRGNEGEEDIDGKREGRADVHNARATQQWLSLTHSQAENRAHMGAHTLPHTLHPAHLELRCLLVTTSMLLCNYT